MTPFQELMKNELISRPGLGKKIFPDKDRTLASRAVRYRKKVSSDELEVLRPDLEELKRLIDRVLDAT